MSTSQTASAFLGWVGYEKKKRRAIAFGSSTSPLLWHWQEAAECH